MFHQEYITVFLIFLSGFSWVSISSAWIQTKPMGFHCPSLPHLHHQVFGRLKSELITGGPVMLRYAERQTSTPFGIPAGKGKNNVFSMFSKSHQINQTFRKEFLMWIKNLTLCPKTSTFRLNMDISSRTHRTTKSP